MADNRSATDFVSSHFQEAVKTHSVYDGSNRLSEFYSALTNSEHGDQCMRTRYTYDGATTRMVGMKEELSTWNSAWDI